jgi:hypothetical protein
LNRQSSLLVASVVFFQFGCSSRSGPDAIALRSNDTKKVQSVVSASKLEIPQEHHFGTVPLGASVPITIPVSNRSESVVRLTFAGADCGCVSGEKSVVLPPGGDGSLELKLNAASEGSIHRKVVYRVSGLQDLELLSISLVGSCEGNLVSPHTVDLGTIGPGDIRDVELTLQAENRFGWDFLSATQVAGPSSGALVRDSAEPSKLRVSVQVPNSSSNAFRWTYELAFADSGGQQACTELVSVICAVSNWLFEENVLYMGVVKSGPNAVVERRFKLRCVDVDLKRVKIDHEKSVSLSIERSHDRNDEAIVRLIPATDAPVGMHSATFTVNPDATRNSGISIPVTWVVLP